MNKFGVVALVAGGLVTAGAIFGFGQPSKPGSAPAPAKGDQPKPTAAKPPEGMVHGADAPGPMHAKIMKLAGSWDVVTKLEVPGMDKPTETKGTTTATAALDGRFLHESGTGDMEGQAVKSFKLWGYNNASKKYEGTWTWTMSTGLLHVEGESKDGGKTIDWNAWYIDENGKRADFKIMYTFADDDHYTIKIYGGKMPDGSPGPTMTTTCTRKK